MTLNELPPGFKEKAIDTCENPCLLRNDILTTPLHQIV